MKRKKLEKRILKKLEKVVEKSVREATLKMFEELYRPKAVIETVIEPEPVKKAKKK